VNADARTQDEDVRVKVRQPSSIELPKMRKQVERVLEAHIITCPTTGSESCINGLA
jgi:hypothetical protein